MSKKCLYCYQKIEGDSDFHEKCSIDFFGAKTPPLMGYSMNQMAELAKSILERRIAVPGVQAKLSLSVIDESLKDGHQGRLTIVGALGGNFIFKPPSTQFPEMPQNEHLTMLMAKSVFGIRTIPSSLIRLASGELGYITRRIDRTSDGNKIHMLDMFQILEAFDKYKGSLERIGKAISAYSANTLLDQLFYFELVLFSYITGNSDMHLKNFSMIVKNSDWEMAPAYDLLSVKIVLPEDEEELALPIEAKKRKLKLDHFSRFGVGLGLSGRQIKNVYSRFTKSQAKAFELLDESFLSEEMCTAYKSLMTERMNNLFEQ